MRRIFTLLRYKVKYVTSSSKKWKWKRLEGLNTLEKNCFSLRTTTQTQWTTNQSTILKKHPKDQRIGHKVIQNSMFILSITANMAHRHSHIHQVRWPQVTQFIPQYMLYGISQLLPVFHHFQQKVLTPLFSDNILLFNWSFLHCSKPQVSCYQYIQLHSFQRLFSISNTG